MNFKNAAFTVLLFSIASLFSLSKMDKDFNENKDFQLQISSSKAIMPTIEYRVHRAGLLWLNTSNMGHFGNPFNYVDDPCTGKPAISGEMPGGSGTSFVFAGCLWLGGYLDSTTVDVNGVDATIFQGPLVSTSYEGWIGFGGPNDMPLEIWPVKFDEDESGTTLGHIRETSNVEGRISCLFEDVYDPSATAEEQFNTMYTDKFVERYYTGMDADDQREHVPLGIEVKEKSYAWSYAYAQKFIIIDYTLYNRNEDQKDIYDFFMCMYLDCDIGNYSDEVSFVHSDDLCGFIQKWDDYIDPATGEQKTVDLNLAWSADNDGRNYTGDDPYWATDEPGSGSPLDGATGVATIRVLRNPNPNLRFSYNIANYSDWSESLDWGPHWKAGLHSDWAYDLTPRQKGYDDTNYDGLTNSVGEERYGGRTEGRPIGDSGKYMMMSNDEFDYNQTSIREVYLGMDIQADGTPIPQSDKWQPWIVTGTEGPDEVPDGTIAQLNDIANGIDQRSFLSFGPLGNECYVNVAYDSDQDSLNTLDDVKNQKAWKFAYGDSLKLTIAFIVSENFHTSLNQDPNYDDNEIVDLTDGLDVSLYDKGWYDAFYNVVWAERVYDIPMFDTPVTEFGETKTDGWYGEDVGEDGTFADIINSSDRSCWWFDQDYFGADTGEADFELTVFSSELTDIYGNVTTSEDNLLPFGRQESDPEGEYGITGSSDTGEGYGYMVKYDKLDGSYPQGTWVRFGYDNGRVDVGDGVPDFKGPSPPPSPKINISYDNKNVIVEWCSHEFIEDEEGNKALSGPEHDIDKFSRRKDFEGYQVMLSPNSNSQKYVDVFSVDKLNYAYENVVTAYDYLDTPVSADSVLSNPDLFPPTISYGRKIYQLVPFKDNRSMYETVSNELFTYSATPDSSMLNEYGVIWNYKFILHDKLYAKQNYIAVTASDNGDPKTSIPELQSAPSINGTSIIPSKIDGTNEVIVVPNPYRGDVDYQSLGWENTDGGDWYEQERKIVFMNLPRKCVIKIYTIAGDLCKTIGHNGDARVDAPWQHGEYGASWNFINENNQAVVSGIYLFSVQDVESDFEFIGKFVIIK